jgi:nucleotide-binding universal stress UspA family protein
VVLKNLIVALDGSACASHAFEFALTLARVESSKLAVCSVADPSPLYGTLEPADLLEQALAEMNRHAQRVVTAAIEKARADGITAEGSVLEGDPVYEIVRYAIKNAADAVVLGTHGRSGLSRLFMGSVAEGVLRSAPTPVVTVREQAVIEPVAQSGTRVMIPVDGSEHSQRALDVAIDLAQSFRAELVIVNVIDLARVGLLAGGDALLVQDSLEEVETEGTAIADAALARVGGRVPASSRIARGTPSDEIERLAGEIRPVMIVMGSHGRTGLSRALLGSVAEGVVRGAPVPVMVVPAKRDAPAES